MALVDVKVAGNLGIMVLNNGKYNQLSLEMFDALGSSLDDLSQNDDVRVMIVTANPGPVFCAGADVNMIFEVAQSGDADKITRLLNDLHSLANRIAASDQRIISAVNGVCFGGGLEISLACHFILGAPLAQFALPEVTLGIIPGLGGTQRLPRRIGLKPALKLMLSGERISAEQAFTLGLVDRVIEGDFIAGIKAFAAQVLSGAVQPRPAVTVSDIGEFPEAEMQEFGKGRSEHAAFLATDAAFHGIQMDLRDALELEIKYFTSAVMHPDATAGVTAFLKKQQPVFLKIVGV